MSSSYEVREKVANAIATAYAKVVTNSSAKGLSSDAQNVIESRCNTTTPDGKTNFCDICVKEFGVDPSLNARDRPKDIQEGTCYGLCTCVIDGVSMFAKIEGGSIASLTVDTDMAEEIAHDAKTTLDSQLSTNVDENDIIDIVTSIKEDAKQSATQTIAESQTIFASGTGYTIQNVDMSVLTNAAMSAIMSASARADASGNVLDKIVADEVNEMENFVDNSVTGVLKYVWKDNAMWLIPSFVAIVVAVAVIVIIRISK